MEWPAACCTQNSPAHSSLASATRGIVAAGTNFALKAKFPRGAHTHEPATREPATTLGHHGSPADLPTQRGRPAGGPI